MKGRVSCLVSRDSGKTLQAVVLSWCGCGFRRRPCSSAGREKPRFAPRDFAFPVFCFCITNHGLGNPPGAARVSRVVMRTSRRKNAKEKCEEKVVIRSAACAVFALALLLAPVPTRCADGPAPLTVEDCRGTSKGLNPPPWVDGTSGPDTCWAAKHDSKSSFLRISPPPQVPAKWRPSMYMFCEYAGSHRDDCPRSEYCARTPDRDGPHWLVVNFYLEQRRPAAAEPKRTRRRMPRPRKHQEIPLRVGLWSKFHAGGGGRLHAASRSGALSAGESRLQRSFGLRSRSAGRPGARVDPQAASRRQLRLDR